MTMKALISIFFLSLSLCIYSQRNTIDSLENQLKRIKGKEYILTLNELANQYGYIDYNKSISLAKEALRLAVISKCNSTKARSYNIIGRAYYISNNLKAADGYYDKGIATAKRYNTPDDIYKALRLKALLYMNGYEEDSVVIKKIFKDYFNTSVAEKKYSDFSEMIKLYSHVYYSKPTEIKELFSYLDQLKSNVKEDSEFLSVIYASEGFLLNQKLDYFKSIEKYNEAIKLTRNISNKVSYLERIGINYFVVREYKESIRFYNDAYKLLETTDFERKKSMSCLIEADFGASYLKLKDYKAGLFYLKKVLDSNNFIQLDKGHVLQNIGVAYFSVDSLDRAAFYFNKAELIFDNLKVNNEKLGLLNCKAELYKRRKQWKLLTQTIEEISKLSNDVKDYYIIYDSYEFLSEYYEDEGNYKLANKYLKKWITANDSISNRELATKMKEFEFKYETEKKEQQIALQQTTIKNKNQLLILAIVAGSIIFVAMLVIFILYRIRNKAYKQLVYQSLENTTNALFVKVVENTEEENTIKIKNGISPLDESIKNQIEISLNKQIDKKVYLESNLILKTLAEKCNTNRSYLSQFINEKHGMNFNTYINMLRINETKLILSDKNNNTPLKELYLRLGFNTYSVFNEAFKKHVGVTPYFYLKTVADLFETPNSNKKQ